MLDNLFIGSMLAGVASLAVVAAGTELFRMVRDGRLELDAQVVARDADAYDVLLERLSGSDRFSDVLPGPEAREGEVRVRVRMTYEPSGAVR